LSENRKPTPKNLDLVIFPSNSSQIYLYSPQIREKSASNQLSLAAIPILGQAHRPNISYKNGFIKKWLPFFYEIIGSIGDVAFLDLLNLSRGCTINVFSISGFGYQFYLSLSLIFIIKLILNWYKHKYINGVTLMARIQH